MPDIEILERKRKQDIHFAKMLRLFADKLEDGCQYDIGHETGYTPETTQDNHQMIHGLSSELPFGKLRLDFSSEINIDEDELNERLFE